MVSVAHCVFVYKVDLVMFAAYRCGYPAILVPYRYRQFSELDRTPPHLDFCDVAITKTAPHSISSISPLLLTASTCNLDASKEHVKLYIEIDMRQKVEARCTCGYISQDGGVLAIGYTKICSTEQKLTNPVIYDS
jgi:hypothetical protein